MNRQRRPFRGVLYAGLMMTYQGPKVLEFNCRFGDPECQPLLMRLKTDLLDVLEAAVDGKLHELPPLEWDPRPAVCVVMAAKGYPDATPRVIPSAVSARPTPYPTSRFFMRARRWTPWGRC